VQYGAVRATANPGAAEHTTDADRRPPLAFKAQNDNGLSTTGSGSGDIPEL